MRKKQVSSFSLVLNRNFIFLIWTIMEIRQRNLMIMPVYACRELYLINQTEPSKRHKRIA